ncbi:MULTISPECIES: ABC transporter substrate-binding protein [Paenibacillus]|uniref:ABC transporter substrate-binding protein n=1 Tax=Paenibacillus TaxID=44249 RepID=UPI0022B90D83|nr:extracellular solute-binding protein [Paenibacillus caseinilyticus]MCZ8519703.1 extracellular solute-binding protein [Paenibacillus caseinilyticus]
MRGKRETPPWEKELGGRPPLREGGYSRELEGRVMQRIASGRVPRTRRRLIRWSPVLACGLLLAIGITQADSLAGWAGRIGRDPGAEGSALNGGKPIVLKVASDSAADFMASYGQAFEKRYPNAKLRVIPLGGRSAFEPEKEDSAWTAWLRAEKPDVLELAAGRTFSMLAEEGRLLALEEASREEGWEAGRMHTGVMESLRRLGGGGLYGIAPEYDQLALYYHPALFGRYGVPAPRDGMTWEQLLGTASRFASVQTEEGERIYGLAAGEDTGLVDGMLNAAAGGGLDLLDPAGRFSLQSAQWSGLWGQAVEAVRRGAVYTGRMQKEAKRAVAAQPTGIEKDGGQGGHASGEAEPGGAPAAEGSAVRLFLEGRAAMVLGDYDFARRLDEASRTGASEASKDWNVATEPTVSVGPGEVSTTFALRKVYAAAAVSEQQEAALTLVKWIAGEEAAKGRAAAAGEQHLPARLPGLTLRLLQGKHAEAFYRLRPSQPEEARVLPAELAGVLPLLAAERLEAAAAGRQTPEAALRQLEAEAQAVPGGSAK